MSVFPESGLIVLYDLEFTSWPGFREQNFRAPGRYPEVIQIGAVKLDAGSSFDEIDSFVCHVVPYHNPTLSDYIIALTGITQADIDQKGMPFADALAAFCKFVEFDTKRLYSFGCDGSVLRLNMELNNIDDDINLPDEVDLRRFMIDADLVDHQTESSHLPALFGLDLDLRAHNALMDARGLGRTLKLLRHEGRI